MKLVLMIWNPRYALPALSLFIPFFLFFTFWDISNLPSTLHQHLGAANLRHHHVDVVNATAHELNSLYDASFNISDFALMGERVSLFSSLAESTLSARPIDTKPLLARLKQYFPWWQPRPTTYAPWQRDPSDQTGGTGIVICAGSSNLIYAVHLVLSLRNVLNSKLPIQIAYAGDTDLSFTDRVNITDLGPDIDTLNLLDYFDEGIAGLHDGGWAMKPFAMLASRFQKTIVMDADAMFVRSPDDLFDTEPGLIETGTLFWHDRAFNPDSAEPLTWVKSLIGDGQPSALLNSSLLWQKGLFHEMDSAAVCMDKGRPGVFMSLLFATWMNLKEVRDEVTYRHVHGDKETFWLACELSHTPYYYNPVYAGIIGTPNVLQPPAPEALTDDTESEDTPKESEDTPKESVDTPKESEDTSKESEDPPNKTISETMSHNNGTDSGTEESNKRPATESLPSNFTSTPAHEPFTEIRAGVRELNIRDEVPPQNQTLDLHGICSAQALHLDHRLRPLWFNGSLRKDKSLIHDSLERLRDLLLLARGEMNADARAEIRSIAEKVALGKFTHWMPGARNWSETAPDYRVGTTMSCLVIQENATELDTTMRENLEKMVDTAREVDQHYYGFDRANITLVADD